MRAPRFAFALCVSIAALGLVVLGMWLALSEPASGPLGVKVLKVTLMAAQPGNRYPDMYPHEKIELELTNKSAQIIGYHSLIIRSDTSPGKVLAATDRGVGRSKPGETVRLTFVAFDRHKTGRTWESWQPRLYYGWQYEGQPLRMRIRKRYNDCVDALWKKYQIQFPRAMMYFDATVPRIVMPPYTEAARTTPR